MTQTRRHATVARGQSAPHAHAQAGGALRVLWPLRRAGSPRVRAALASPAQHTCGLGLPPRTRSRALGAHAWRCGAPADAAIDHALARRAEILELELDGGLFGRGGVRHGCFSNPPSASGAVCVAPECTRTISAPRTPVRANELRNFLPPSQSVALRARASRRPRPGSVHGLAGWSRGGSLGGYDAVRRRALGRRQDPAAVAGKQLRAPAPARPRGRCTCGRGRQRVRLTSCEPVGQVVARDAQGSQPAPKYAGVLQALRLVVREEGVRSLWKGNLTAELLWGAYMASQFFIYRACQVGVLPRAGALAFAHAQAHDKGRLGQCPGFRCIDARARGSRVLMCRPSSCEQRTLVTERSAPAPHEGAGSAGLVGARTMRVLGDLLCGGIAGGVATGKRRAVGLCVRAYVCDSTSDRVYIINVRTHTNTHVCVYACMHACMYVCMYTRTYAYTHTHMHIYIYLYTNI